MTAHFKLQYPEQRTTLSFINLTDKNNSNNTAALTKRSRCKCRADNRRWEEEVEKKLGEVCGFWFTDFPSEL